MEHNWAFITLVGALILAFGSTISTGVEQNVTFPKGVVNIDPMTLSFRHAANTTLRIPLIPLNFSGDISLVLLNPTSCFDSEKIAKRDFSIGDEKCKMSFEWGLNEFRFGESSVNEKISFALLIINRVNATLILGSSVPMELEPNEYCKPMFVTYERILVVTLWQVDSAHSQCDVKIILQGNWTWSNDYTPTPEPSTPEDPFDVVAIIVVVAIIIVPILLLIACIYCCWKCLCRRKKRKPIKKVKPMIAKPKETTALIAKPKEVEKSKKKKSPKSSSSTSDSSEGAVEKYKRVTTNAKTGIIETTTLKIVNRKVSKVNYKNSRSYPNIRTHSKPSNHSI